MKIIDLSPDAKEHILQAAAVIVAAFREPYPHAWSTFEDGLEEVHEMLEEDRICRIALMDGRVVGWIGGIPQYDGNVWELHPLAVHPDNQKQGVGRRLVSDFEEQVSRRGGITMIVGSDDEYGTTSLYGVDVYDNPSAHIAGIRNLKGHPFSFYEKSGFKIVGLVPDANGIGKPDIILAKRVKPQ